MKKIIYLSIVLSLLSSCSNKQAHKQSQEENVQQEKSFYTIDLSKDFSGSDNQTLLLSDIVEDVEYVKLETTDDCLLAGTARVFITNDDIYTLNNYSDYSRNIRSFGKNT